MYKTNKKGFTLIELLVAISILGLITILVLPQVSNLQTGNKETKYRKYADSLMTSAKLYTDSYSEDMFGYNTSGCYDIPYAKLKEKDLVKDIKINGENCAGGEDALTYVRVYKSNTHYNYKVSIYCVDSKQQEVYSKLLSKGGCDGLRPDTTPPEISISPSSSSTWKNSSDIKVTVKISDQYGMSENTKIKYTWTKTPYNISEDEYKEYNFENNLYDDNLKLAIKSPKEVEGEYYLVVKPVDVKDANGNYTTSGIRSDSFKIDDIAPNVPEVGLYKWSNNSTRPTSSSGLSKYTSSTWSTKKIYTTASGSTDSGSGIDHYEYTTTGKTTNATNQEGASRSIEADGTSYIKYRACDKAGNCSDYGIQYTVKVDKTAPNIPTVKLYKWKSNSTRPTSSSGLTTYTNNTWSNKKIYTTATSTDITSGIDHYEYTTTGKTTNATNQEGASRSIEADGTSTIKYRVCDKAGNCSAYGTTYTVKVDKTVPSIPTVGIYKWTNNDTRPTSSNGLTTYTNNTWSNKKIYTTATSTDITSGIDRYEYTTTGKTTNATNQEGASRSIEADGTSYIKYRACDKAGNCSDYGIQYTVKVDKTAPTCTNSGDSTTWTNSSRTIKYGCNDSHSGCDSSYSGGSKTFSSNTKTGTISSYTIKDKAGNTTTCAARTANVYVDTTAPTCTNSGDSTTWTNSSRTIKYGCSDSESGCNTSYSGGSKSFSSTAKTGTIASYTIKDEAGNTTTCAARTANVYVDTTAPTCTNSGDSTTWTNSSRTIKYGCSDSHSGCNSSYSGGSKTFSSTAKTGTIASYTIKDQAGNTTTCAARTANVYVDTTAPTCTNSGDSTTWTNSSRTIKYGCSDSESGCNTSYSGGSKSFSSTAKTGTISSYTIKDKAGNTTTCAARTANVYVDKTPPTVPTVNLYQWKDNSTRPTSSSGLTRYTAGTTSNKKIYTTASGSTDSHSGFDHYEYTTTGETTNHTNKKASSRNIEANGTSYIKYRACDKVNNCSAYSTAYKIIIDKNPATVTGNISNWICGKCRPKCDDWAAKKNGSCITTKANSNGYTYGNTAGKVTATVSGKTVTFNWEIYQGAETYIGLQYYVKFRIKNTASGSIVYTKNLKSANAGTVWDKGSSHSGSAEYTFTTAGTYKIYIEGNAENPSFNMNFGTITVS